MKYTGFSYNAEDDFEIKDAVIVDDRFAMDFVEEGDEGTVITTSTDGFFYKGDYSFKDGDSGQCEFQRFDGKDGSVVMAGKYWRPDEGTEGFWFVHLIASQDESATQPLPRHRILFDMLGRPEEYTHYTAMMQPPPKKRRAHRRRSKVNRPLKRAFKKVRAKVQRKAGKPQARKTTKQRKRGK